MEYSKITDLLFVGTTPKPQDYNLLRDLGVHLVINMRAERPPYRDPGSPPINTLWIPTFDSPLLPISLKSLQRGVQAALETINSDRIVYSHCAAGMHRSVALASSILIALGYTLEEAMALIKQRREVADPHAWYIQRRIKRFAQFWEQFNTA